MERFSEADRCFNTVTRINPKNEEAWFKKGLNLYKNLKNSLDAIKCFDRVTKANKKSEKGWFYKGLILTEAFKKDSEAERCFSEAIKINPEYKDALFVSLLSNKFKKLVRSTNFNERYFSIYLIKKHYNELINNNPDFKGIITEDQLTSLRRELIDYFLSEIDSFCLIDKLKLLKQQFKTIEIPKDMYNSYYKNYKL